MENDRKINSILRVILIILITGFVGGTLAFFTELITRSEFWADFMIILGGTLAFYLGILLPKKKLNKF